MIRVFYLVTLMLLTVYACAPFTGSDATFIPDALEGGVGREDGPYVAPRISVQDSGTTIDASVDIGNTMDASSRVCVTDLSNILFSDFHVSFRLRTTAKGNTTLVYQRNVCSHGVFWDIHLSGEGSIAVELDNNNVNYVSLETTQTVSDGLDHDIDVIRSYEVMDIYIDGVAAGHSVAVTNLGALSPLGYVSGDPCEAAGLYAPLVGSLTSLCVSSP